MADSKTTEETLPSLIEFAKSAELEELVWEEGDQRVSFRRKVNQPSPPAPKADVSKSPEEPDRTFITSPMVGTFWRSPSNDRPPLVVEGGQVSSGQKCGVVIAMSVPKDVVSNLKGKIISILVDNGKPVEYGQRIFEIEVER